MFLHATYILHSTHILHSTRFTLNIQDYTECPTR